MNEWVSDFFPILFIFLPHVLLSVVKRLLQLLWRYGQLISQDISLVTKWWIDPLAIHGHPLKSEELLSGQTAMVVVVVVVVHLLLSSPLHIWPSLVAVQSTQTQLIAGLVSLVSRLTSQCSLCASVFIIHLSSSLSTTTTTTTLIAACSCWLVP